MKENLDELTKDELLAKVILLVKDMKTAKETIVRQERIIENLRSMTRNYYHANSDYVPQPENDRD